MTEISETPARTPLSTGLKITFVALAALAVAAVATIIVLSLGARPTPTQPAAKPVVSQTATVTPTQSPTPTPTAAPAAPAEVVPEPEAPAPAEPAPAPAPAPPPVVTPLSIDDMYAYYPSTCGATGPIVVGWSASGALAGSAELLVKTGGGTPVFNQTWSGYQPADQLTLNIDCTRPLWYFKLTVSSATGTKTALLTFSNGQSQGWSSN